MIDPGHDGRFMAAALALGRQGRGRTLPNPSVGAVIVQPSCDGGGIVVGAGRTADGGRPHAETVALSQAGGAARGATAYVTLEPCSHFGKTPPCADALVAAGVAEVVVAMTDLNPVVAGSGLQKLRDAGIAVRVGVRAADAARDLEGYFSRMGRGRPHVTLKLAVSADGAIGRAGEGQVAISGPQSRARVHLLRAQHDAIAVGIGTVLADNPRLDCRLPGMAGQSPRRFIFDTAARIPPDALLLTGGAATTVLIGDDALPARRSALEKAGIDVHAVQRSGQTLDLPAALAHMADRGMGSLLVEGGGRIAEALAANELIDAAIIVTGPGKVGGRAIRPFGGDALGRLSAYLPRANHLVVGEDRWTYLDRPCSLDLSPISAPLLP